MQNNSPHISHTRSLALSGKKKEQWGKPRFKPVLYAQKTCISSGITVHYPSSNTLWLPE